MLELLHIENIAIIEAADIEFAHSSRLPYIPNHPPL